MFVVLNKLEYNLMYKEAVNPTTGNTSRDDVHDIAQYMPDSVDAVNETNGNLDSDDGEVKLISTAPTRRSAWTVVAPKQVSVLHGWVETLLLFRDGLFIGVTH